MIINSSSSSSTSLAPWFLGDNTHHHGEGVVVLNPWFAEVYETRLKRRGGCARVGEKDVVEEVLSRTDPPLPDPRFVFNVRQLENNFDAYLAIAQQPHVNKLSTAHLSFNLITHLIAHLKNVAYPVKCNPTFEVLQVIANKGGSAECANQFEVQMAQSNGFPAERIVYNNPSLSDSLRDETDFIIDKVLNKGDHYLNS